MHSVSSPYLCTPNLTLKTLQVFAEKNLHKGPAHYKPVLFKGQLYSDIPFEFPFHRCLYIWICSKIIIKFCSKKIFLLVHIQMSLMLIIVTLK